MVVPRTRAWAPVILALRGHQASSRWSLRSEVQHVQRHRWRRCRSWGAAGARHRGTRSPARARKEPRSQGPRQPHRRPLADKSGHQSGGRGEGGSLGSTGARVVGLPCDTVSQLLSVSAALLNRARPSFRARYGRRRAALGSDIPLSRPPLSPERPPATSAVPVRPATLMADPCDSVANDRSRGDCGRWAGSVLRCRRPGLVPARLTPPRGAELSVRRDSVMRVRHPPGHFAPAVGQLFPFRLWRPESCTILGTFKTRGACAMSS